MEILVQRVDRLLVARVGVDRHHVAALDPERASCSTLAIGARQFVVHEPFEITVIRADRVGVHAEHDVASTPSAGAETSTFLAPAVISSGEALSLLVNSPVHSIATSTPW